MIGGEEKMKRENKRERDYEVSKMSFDVNIIYGMYNEYQMKQKNMNIKISKSYVIILPTLYLNAVPMSIY